MVPEVSRSEVRMHDAAEDCWIIIRNEVFNLTNFLMIHPAGMEIILEHAGSDATDYFESCGHSMHARVMMDRFKVGILPESEQDNNLSAQHIAYGKIGLVA